MNGQHWTVEFVNSSDRRLIDRTGIRTVATTDPRTHTVYVSNDIRGVFLIRVMIHEMTHCAMFSYGLIPIVHTWVTPDKWVQAEEWVCNFIADYGIYIFKALYATLGMDALSEIPYELNLLFGAGGYL